MTELEVLRTEIDELRLEMANLAIWCATLEGRMDAANRAASSEDEGGEA